MSQKKIRLVKFNFSLLVFLFFSFTAYSQRTIIGKIINSTTNNPILGATVEVKGTKTGSQTNAEGNFSITVPKDNSTLVISVVGFENKEINTSGKTDQRGGRNRIYITKKTRYYRIGFDSKCG
jgi:hypothetical protein